MFELKNFYVKQGGKFLVEDVNFQFRSPNKYQVICESEAQKDAFVGGLLGFTDYATLGNIIWKSKWKLEIKDTAERMADKFFLFTDKIPNLNFLTVQELISNLGNGLSRFKTHKIFALIKQYGLPPSFLNKNVDHNLTNEEKQKLQLIELSFLEPEFVIVDLKNPVADFAKYLAASPLCFSVIIMVVHLYENRNSSHLRIKLA